MHPMFFGIKRVHLRTLAVSRTLLAEFLLTPARFDLMRVVELHSDGIVQRNIQYLLGVSAPTVSRMLKALELLGMIRRKRREADRRCVDVHITEVGRYFVGLARDELIESGIAQRFALRGLARKPRTARPQLTLLQRFLSSIRKAYGDSPLFPHPWRIGCVDEPYVYTTIVDGRLALTSVDLNELAMQGARRSAF